MDVFTLRRAMFLILVPIGLLLAACAGAPATGTPANTPTAPVGKVTPTLSASSGTVIREEGQSRVFSNPSFFWTLTLPSDWVVTADTGFELKATNPQKTANLYLLSQTWKTKAEQLPDARGYVNYWKKTDLGDLFPVFADGKQVSETEISRGQFGGPYLRYEFDDAKHGLRYLQVYASGSGPNSLVLTTWAKSADFASLQSMLDGILDSVALVKK